MRSVGYIQIPCALYCNQTDNRQKTAVLYNRSYGYIILKKKKKKDSIKK